MITTLRRSSWIVGLALCLSGTAAAATPGGPDPAFGQGGLVATDMGGTDDSGWGVVVDADGCITVVGEARQDDQHLRTFALVRYTADGTLDSGFGDGGAVYTEFGEFQGSGAYAAALQPDGGLVVAGFGRHPEKFHDTFAVARYLRDGTLDPTFGHEGRLLTAVEPQTGAGPADIAHAVAIDADGRIVVAGETGGLFKDFAIVRYLSDGQLDPAFGTDGVVVTDLGGHGTGGQTRAFIHLQDSVRCIELALENPPAHGDRVAIFNQMTETHRVRDLAKMVSDRTGVEVAHLPNPRNEADENELHVANDRFLGLGLEPITLSDGLMEEVTEVTKKYADRCDQGRIPCASVWSSQSTAAVTVTPTPV